MCLVLAIINISNCDVKLRILRISDENYTPVIDDVEYEAGRNISLSCELWSSSNDTVYDDQIRWGKSTSNFIFKTNPELELLVKKKSKKLYQLLKHEDSKPVKMFYPLKVEDEGLYFCVSIKYSLFRMVHLFVRNNNQTFQKHTFNKSTQSLYCNEKMFRCKNSSIEICIPPRFVCDGHNDCKDRSDEDFELCKGEPCSGKILCDDGRCIPTAWCCDPNLDSQCTVTFRPSCCLQLTDTYEETVNIYPVQIGYGRSKTRYIFISLCALATLFAIALMLLIVSKIYLFAKKQPTTCVYNRRHYHLASELRHPDTRVTCITAYLDMCLLEGRMPNIPDLREEMDSPPPYSDVVIADDQSQLPHRDLVVDCDAPPPYNSTEMINELPIDEQPSATSTNQI